MLRILWLLWLLYSLAVPKPMELGLLLLKIVRSLLVLVNVYNIVTAANVC